MPINGLRRIWTSSIRPKLKSSIKSLFRCGRIFSFLSISRIPITLVTFSFRRSTMIFACQTSVERFQKNIRFPMTLIPSFHVLCMRGSSIRLQNSPAMSSPPICSNHRLLNCIRFIVPCLSLQTNPIPSGGTVWSKPAAGQTADRSPVLWLYQLLFWNGMSGRPETIRSEQGTSPEPYRRDGTFHWSKWDPPCLLYPSRQYQWTDYSDPIGRTDPERFLAFKIYRLYGCWIVFWTQPEIQQLWRPLFHNNAVH